MIDAKETLEMYMKRNEERLLREWSEHLEYMQDSMEHIGRLALNAQAFRDFCAAQYESEGGVL